MSQKIDLNALNNLSEKQMMAILVTEYNSQVEVLEQLGRKIDVFVQIIDSKVTRDEFDRSQDKTTRELDSLEKRLKTVEDSLLNKEISKVAIMGAGRSIWIWILGAMNIIQFIIMASKSGQD